MKKASQQEKSYYTEVGMEVQTNSINNSSIIATTRQKLIEKLKATNQYAFYAIREIMYVCNLYAASYVQYVISQKMLLLTTILSTSFPLMWDEDSFTRMMFFIL